MQRLDLFVCDAGLADLNQVEYGLRVDEGEEADEVAWDILGFECGMGGVFEGGEGVRRLPWR